MANSFQVDDYLRTDAALYYRRGRLKTAINIRNLFDIYYISSVEGHRSFLGIGEPFTIVGSISWEFQLAGFVALCLFSRLDPFFSQRARVGVARRRHRSNLLPAKSFVFYSTAMLFELRKAFDKAKFNPCWVTYCGGQTSWGKDE
ncbi:hypothetical protein [uncultured Nostoc sp.]|uniref:hypothetical protein n=1 Tax=uncultured Nostoc sp. TaxID=340711 RepID=UPI002623B9B1|nr:hypothetical protein [uncultured Nostoc sp.]